MCSVSTFLSTLPGYLLGQDNQSSPQATSRSLQCKTLSRAPYAAKMDSNTSHSVIYSGYRRNFQQKEPVCPQCKEANLRSEAPQPSSASHRGSFPCTTPRLPRYATGESFRGTVPNLPQQATPSFSDKPPSLPQHACNGIVRKIQLLRSCEDFSIVWTRMYSGYQT